MRARRQLRGYALGFVVTVLTVLGLGASVVVYVLAAGIADTRRALGEQRIFYSCDSAIRLASRISESVVLANPRAPADQVTQMAMDAICAAAGGCAGTRTGMPFVAEYLAPSPGVAVGPDAFMPTHSDMEKFKLVVKPLQNVNTIQAGAFQDLFAIQSDVQIEVQGIHVGTGTVARAMDRFGLATIAPFQLMAFATSPLSWTPFTDRTPVVPPGVSLARVGPSVYSDGDLSLTAGGRRLQLTRAVSKGTMTSSGADIWNGDLGAPVFAGFSGPDGVRASQIRTGLTLPVQPAAKPAQPAAELQRSTRWLLDPPMINASGDNAGAQEAKLAGQADIRIIDGVWFVRPQTGGWPGIPVWSDHMGSGVKPVRVESRILMSADGSGAAGTLPDIGQQDIMSAAGMARIPQRFSYYEPDAGLGAPAVTRDLANTGVVFYGNAKQRGGALVPGAWDGGGVGSLTPCGDDTGTPGPTVDIIPFNRCTRPIQGLMDGARYGFRDISAQQDGGNSATKVLPMNFDVAEFLTALQDGREGELGSYFCGARVDANDPSDVPAAGCRRFNGIIWISATWNGSLAGLSGAGSPAMQPPQGRGLVAPIVQPFTFPPGPPTTPIYWMPEQLCTGMALHGQPYDNEPTFLAGNHRAIACDPTPLSVYDLGYGTGVTAPKAGVTALRIVNGKDLSRIIAAQVPDRLGTTQGLTIASNLPVYVSGDFNTIRGAPFATGVNCTVTPADPSCIVPRTLIAGDRITLQSNAGGGVTGNEGWLDRAAPWDRLPLGGTPIQARRTTYVAAFMSALPRVGAPINVESLFGWQERWDNAAASRMTVLGAMYVTGRSYYRPDPQVVMGGYAPNPQLFWTYNASLSTLNQPPGTPRFLIGVTNRWRDLRATPTL
jgi:hypothetical protein